MNAVTIAEYVFAATFLSMFAVGLFIIGYGVAQVCCVFVRFFKPGFALPYETPAPEREDTPHDQKRVALDFIFQHRRDVMKALHAEHHVSAATINELMQKRIDANEFDLESVAKLIAKPVPPKNMKLEKQLTEKAEYGLCRFPEGPQGTPRYLITKMSERGVGLRSAFAALPDKCLRLDLVSAQRLAAMMPDVFVVPMNASARIATRKFEGGKEHATR